MCVRAVGESDCKPACLSVILESLLAAIALSLDGELGNSLASLVGNDSI